MNNNNDVEQIKQLSSIIKQVKSEIGKVIVGQQHTIDELIIALFAKGHVLLIGVPGLAKTLLIKTLSQAMDLKFSRIQFTPDLMPGDISGSEIIEDDVSTGKKNFRFIKGPIFSNIVLADEINRTPPKTQAALLEAMEEHSVTAAGHTYKLDNPFFVLATQNPIEQEGTYPLPEAQLDRFMFNIWLDYPDAKDEVDIVRSTTALIKPSVQKVITGVQINEFQDLIRKVPVTDNVIEFAVKLVRNTRPNYSNYDFIQKYLSYGAGPRASQYLILGAKSRAAINGSFSPSIDDVKQVALSVMRHRIVTNFSAEAEGISPGDVIKMLVDKV
ncbi:MAG TPA: MoxR family ATPase [Candidatus Kapabacteria bacterium]|nr:MoxR family ATPase [Candidatus Kapabacteria bacterium]